MSKESEGTVEKVVRYGNYVDAGAVIYGVATGNATIVILGISGLIAGLAFKQWLERRNKKQYA
jgi:hypothetical protein